LTIQTLIYQFQMDFIACIFIFKDPHTVVISYCLSIDIIALWSLKCICMTKKYTYKTEEEKKC
jgi:hypothetical protein